MAATEKYMMLTFSLLKLGLLETQQSRVVLYRNVCLTIEFNMILLKPAFHKIMKYFRIQNTRRFQLDVTSR